MSAAPTVTFAPTVLDESELCYRLQAVVAMAVSNGNLTSTTLSLNCLMLEIAAAGFAALVVGALFLALFYAARYCYVMVTKKPKRAKGSSSSSKAWWWPFGGSKKRSSSSSGAAWW